MFKKGEQVTNVSTRSKGKFLSYEKDNSVKVEMGNGSRISFSSSKDYKRAPETDSSFIAKKIKEIKETRRKSHNSDSKRLRSFIEKFSIGSKKIDWKGHLFNGKLFNNVEMKKFIYDNVTNICQLSPIPDFRLLKSKNKEAIVATGNNFICPCCGKRMQLITDGSKLSVNGYRCPSEKEVKSTVYNNNSGKIVIGNDFSRIYPTGGMLDLNTHQGRRQHQNDLEKKNLVHLYFEYIENEISVKISEDKKEIIFGEKKDGSKRVLNISKSWKNHGDENSNVQCVSIADYDDFNKRCERHGVKYPEDSYFVLEVEKGRYKFMSIIRPSVNEKKDRADFPHGIHIASTNFVNSTFDLEKTKVVDPLIAFTTFINKFSEIERARLSNEQVEEWCFIAANKFFCSSDTGRFGTSWNINGYPEIEGAYYGTKTTSPNFAKSLSWIPFNKNCALVKGAGLSGIPDSKIQHGILNMDKNWVKIALSICESIISYGDSRVIINQDASITRRPSRERMKLAAKCYEGYRQKYPEVVHNDEFDTWFWGTDYHAENWINTFSGAED